MNLINPALTDILMSMNISLDEKWYPLLLVGVALVVLLCIFLVFSFVRSFLAWMFRIDEQISVQRETNDILIEILHLLGTIQDQNEEILNECTQTRKSLTRTESPAKKPAAKKPQQKNTEKIPRQDV